MEFTHTVYFASLGSSSTLGTPEQTLICKRYSCQCRLDALRSDMFTLTRLLWPRGDCRELCAGQRAGGPVHAYLHPVHAGFHLQLLHSFPGLGDAGGAVIGHAFFHSAAPGTTKVKEAGRVACLKAEPPPPNFLPLPSSAASLSRLGSHGSTASWDQRKERVT